MNFLAILGVITLTLFILFFSIHLISDIVSNKRSMTKLKQWSQFHQKTLDWSKEIKDSRVRAEYINYITNEMLRVKSIESIKSTDIEVKRFEIYSKWGSHIPSLIAEMRDEKIKKLLK